MSSQVSIHALLAESDLNLPSRPIDKNVSIHALLAESDLVRMLNGPHSKKFLSTLSLRRATFRHCTTYLNCSRFYPRSPCGERLEQSASYNAYLEVSIHALLAESDVVGTVKIARPMLFLSTLSLRRATKLLAKWLCNALVSIHALLAESDKLLAKWLCNALVSIHALLAESDAETAHERANGFAFLSTLSLRRATSQQPAGTTRTTCFYPRSPCGERRVNEDRYGQQFWFLSTLSLRRATLMRYRIRAK